MRWLILALLMATSCSQEPARGRVVSKEVVPAHYYQHTDLYPAGKGILIPVTNTRWTDTSYRVCTQWQQHDRSCGLVELDVFNTLDIGEYYE